ncbi:diacylglycerol kinase family protein [Bosea sp. BIWAKO-01]|uniref:diacylglycerol/lipid kinase family protein n=1 Tax=Bosea sp. BIWAKO-01 TaxID=506668 RepID=UPI0008538283|nr:diacylglycerol kinase family protein [Bosea sp. BIWAKO-01]GAU82542.1 diacylglycerol kinase catalytic domain transcription regulator [Bosea sp. BIWAKO-01]
MMFVLFNPVAGRARGLSVRELARLFPESTVVETRMAGDAEKLARQAAEDGHDCIVAVGGDGTISEAASGMIGLPAELGVLPLGTANLFAQELGIPLDIAEAARIINEGFSAPVYPGLYSAAGVPERVFVQTLGVGFDGSVVRRLNKDAKKLVGKLAYVIAAIQCLLLHRDPKFTVRIDGGPDEIVSGLLVMKGRLYAGPFIISENATPKASGFIVALLREGSRFALLKSAFCLVTNRFSSLSFVEMKRANHVSVRGTSDVQIDGDLAPPPPAEIHDADSCVHVRVPRSTAVKGSGTLT